MSSDGTRRTTGSLVVRFALASLAIFVAVGFGLFRVVSDHVVQRELEAARFRGEFVSESVLRLGLDRRDLDFLTPFRGSRYDKMLSFVRHRVLHYPVRHVRLWRSDGEIVFSDTPSQVGRTLRLGSTLSEAFHLGRPLTVVQPRDPLGAASDGMVLDTDVPLYLNGGDSTPVAVAEVVQEYASVQHAKSQTLGGLLPALGMGLAAIYVLLLPTVWRISAKLHRRNAELAEVVQRERAGSEERQRLLEKVLTVSEEERGRMAADLHDGPVQRLAAIGLGLRRLQLKLERQDPEGASAIAEHLRIEIADQVTGLRALMAHLRPPALESLGLRAALRDRVDHAEQEGRLRCVFECDLDAPLAPEIETVLYRVSQESLTNIVKHADARSATVRLHTDNGTVKLEISDDGKGFRAGTANGDRGGEHFGLMAMRERVLSVGGTWDLQSEPGRGTRVVATVPRTIEEDHDGA